MENVYQLALLLWFLSIVAYYGAVTAIGVVEGFVPVLSYGFIVCVIVCCALLWVVGASWRAMKRSGPMPLSLLDLGPAMKIVCLFLASEVMMTTREPVTATGTYSPSYNLVAVAGHLIALFLLSSSLVRSKWDTKPAFEPVRRPYARVFWLQWADFALTLAIASLYDGESFNATRLVLFICGIVCSTLLWIVPMLTPIPSHLLATTLQLVAVLALVDLPIVLACVLDEVAVPGSIFITVAIVVKGLKMLHHVDAIQHSISVLDAALCVTATSNAAGVDANFVDHGDQLDVGEPSPHPKAKKCSCSCCRVCCKPRAASPRHRMARRRTRPCWKKWHTVLRDAWNNSSTCIWTRRVLCSKPRYRAPADAAGEEEEDGSSGMRRQHTVTAAWEDHATVLHVDASAGGGESVPAWVARERQAQQLAQERKMRRLAQRKQLVFRLKADHLASTTLRRRLARRGSSLQSGDSLSDSANWSSEDERRVTLLVSPEEFSQCVVTNEGDGVDPPSAWDMEQEAKAKVKQEEEEAQAKAKAEAEAEGEAKAAAAAAAAAAEAAATAQSSKAEEDDVVAQVQVVHDVHGNDNASREAAAVPYVDRDSVEWCDAESAALMVDYLFPSRDELDEAECAMLHAIWAPT